MFCTIELTRQNALVSTKFLGRRGEGCSSTSNPELYHFWVWQRPRGSGDPISPTLNYSPPPFPGKVTAGIRREEVIINNRCRKMICCGGGGGGVGPAPRCAGGGSRAEREIFHS